MNLNLKVGDMVTIIDEEQYSPHLKSNYWEVPQVGTQYKVSRILEGIRGELGIFTYIQLIVGNPRGITFVTQKNIKIKEKFKRNLPTWW